MTQTHVLFVSVQAINPITTTEFEFRQWVTVNGVTSLVFVVRARNDAHLALGHLPGNFDVNTYQLVIGANSNQQHFLRDGISGENLQVRNDDVIKDVNPFLKPLLLSFRR